MNPIHLFILILATWRLSNLVANEDGPFLMFRRFRRLCKQLCHRSRFCRRFHLWDMVTCEYCNSVWIGSAIAAAYLVAGPVAVYVLLPLALSTGVIFLKRTHERLESA